MISGLHHVATVVPTLEDGAEVWRDGIGLTVDVEATVPEQGVRAALLPCGAGEVELLQALDVSGPIGRFLEKGGGIHHICFQADDVGAELTRLKDAGVRLIDETPRSGLAGQIGFLHPKSTVATLIEIATPGGGVETQSFADPDPPDDTAFKAGAIAGVVFACNDVDAAADAFAVNFEFDVPEAMAALPEIGAQARRIELSNTTVDLARPTDPSGWLAQRLTASGEGAALLRLVVDALEPGAGLTADEGASVVRTKTSAGDDLVLIDGECTFGVDLALVEADR